MKKREENERDSKEKEREKEKSQILPPLVHSTWLTAGAGQDKTWSLDSVPVFQMGSRVSSTQDVMNVSCGALHLKAVLRGGTRTLSSIVNAVSNI